MALVVATKRSVRLQSRIQDERSKLSAASGGAVFSIVAVIKPGNIILNLGPSDSHLASWT